MKASATLRHFLCFASSVLLAISSAHAAILTWDAGGGGGAITNGGGAWLGANLWNDATVAATWTSGDDAIFAGPATAAGNVTLASPTTANSLTFSPSFTGTYTLGTAGQALTLGTGGITMNASSGAATIISPLILGGVQSWTNNSTNALTINAATDLNSNALTIAGSGTTSINGVGTNVISGAGGITVNGARFVLGAGGTSPAHTYSGDTTLTGGSTLLFNSNLSANSNVNLNGGVLESYWTGGLSRTIGTGGNQIRITGGESGFGMNGSNGATFTLGALTWGDTNFNPTKLLLQTQTSGGTSALTLASAINLNGADRTVVAHQGATGAASSTISGNITTGTGTAGLIKEGLGLLTLTGASNTYNGGTTISAGTLAFDKIAAMPSTGIVAVNNATLGIDLGGGGDWTGSSTVAVGTLGGLLGGLGGAGGSTVTYTGNVGLRLNLTGNTTYSGDIANVGTTLQLTKVGGSSLTLSGNNSYTGGTTLSAGTLIVGSANALGTGTGTIALNGGTIQSNDATARSFTNAVTLGGDFTVGGTGNLTFSNTGAVALGATRTITVNTGITATFAQSFSGSTFAINKAGAGTLVLSGTNTYTGTTDNRGGGVLVFNGAAAMGSGPLLVTGSQTGTFRFQSDTGFSKSNAVQLFGTTANLVVDRQTAGSGAGLNYQFTAANASNDFSAGTTVNFSAGSNITSGTPTLTFTNGIRSQSAPGAATNLVASGVNVILNGITTSNRTRTWALQGTSTGNEVTGGITGGGSNVDVTKSGIGTWKLSSTANNYPGSTTITGGTLVLGANNVLPNTTNVTIGTATLDADTRTDTVGTLNATGSAVINLGTGAALAFANSSGVTAGVWAGALNITGTFVSGNDVDPGLGVNPGSIRFGVNSSGLTASQLADITVNGGGTFMLDAFGYLKAGAGGDPYAAWSGGAAFSDDANNDGVDNGMAWVLGAIDKDANAIGLLPTFDNTTDPNFFIFTYRRDDDANADINTTIKAEYGSDLAGWTPAVAGVDIIITPTNDGAAVGIDSVQVKIRRTLAVGGKLFARLNAVKAP